ncbi:hypothetical protein ScPMuIL_000177, partial [Solemya velum]
EEQLDGTFFNGSLSEELLNLAFDDNPKLLPESIVLVTIYVPVFVIGNSWKWVTCIPGVVKEPLEKCYKHLFAEYGVSRFIR